MMAKVKITKISVAILCGILFVLGWKMIKNQLNFDVVKNLAINRPQTNKSIKGEIKTARKFPLRLSDLKTPPDGKYLASGDPDANRVVVYIRQANNS